MNKKLTQLKQKIEYIVSSSAGTYSLELVLPESDDRLCHNPLVLPSASLIKVFIMAEAFRQATCNLDLAQTAAVTPAVRVGGAGPLEHAPYGTRLTLLELIELMIVESDNTATNMLIHILGMNSVNKLAHELDCEDTFLGRFMMDFTARAAGSDNFTSPMDINKLLHRLYLHKCIDPASDQAMVEILLRQTDKCKLPLLLPSNTVIAHKTGELDGIEHDAGIIFGQPPYILTIMTAGLPDEEKGRQTIATLSRLVYDTILE